MLVRDMSLADFAAYLSDTGVTDVLRHLSRKISTLTNVAA